MKLSRDWSSELPKMLERQEPESTYLDYKARDGLLPRPKQGQGIDREKRAEDVSKDVSSFLNSDGGAIVYGIRQDKNPKVTGGAPIPLAAFDPSRDGYDRPEMSKETIENIITSSIEPKPGADLFSVAEVALQGRLVFIVEMAKSMRGAFQAKDKKYYKRFNYKEEAMSHWEIEDVRNRSEGPDLRLVAGFTDRWDSDMRTLPPRSDTGLELPIHLGIRNVGMAMAEIAMLEIGIHSEFLVTKNEPRDWLDAGRRVVQWRTGKGKDANSTLRWFQIRWNPYTGNPRYQPLFPMVDPQHVTRFDFHVPINQYGDDFRGLICWRLQSSNMKPRAGLIGITERWGPLGLEFLDCKVTIETPGTA